MTSKGFFDPVRSSGTTETDAQPSQAATPTPVNPTPARATNSSIFSPKRPATTTFSPTPAPDAQTVPAREPVVTPAPRPDVAPAAQPASSGKLNSFLHAKGPTRPQPVTAVQEPKRDSPVSEPVVTVAQTTEAEPAPVSPATPAVQAEQEPRPPVQVAQAPQVVQEPRPPVQTAQAPQVVQETRPQPQVVQEVRPQPQVVHEPQPQAQPAEESRPQPQMTAPQPEPVVVPVPAAQAGPSTVTVAPIPEPEPVTEAPVASGGMPKMRPVKGGLPARDVRPAAAIPVIDRAEAAEPARPTAPMPNMTAEPVEDAPKKNGRFSFGGAKTPKAEKPTPAQPEGDAPKKGGRFVLSAAKAPKAEKPPKAVPVPKAPSEGKAAPLTQNRRALLGLGLVLVTAGLGYTAYSLLLVPNTPTTSFQATQSPDTLPAATTASAADAGMEPGLPVPSGVSATPSPEASTVQTIPEAGRPAAVAASRPARAQDTTGGLPLPEQVPATTTASRSPAVTVPSAARPPKAGVPAAGKPASASVASMVVQHTGVKNPFKVSGTAGRGESTGGVRQSPAPERVAVTPTMSAPPISLPVRAAPAPVAVPVAMPVPAAPRMVVVRPAITETPAVRTVPVQVMPAAIPAPVAVTPPVAPVQVTPPAAGPMATLTRSAVVATPVAPKPVPSDRVTTWTTANDITYKGMASTDGAQIVVLGTRYGDYSAQVGETIPDTSIIIKSAHADHITLMSGKISKNLKLTGETTP